MVASVRRTVHRQQFAHTISETQPTYVRALTKRFNLFTVKSTGKRSSLGLIMRSYDIYPIENSTVLSRIKQNEIKNFGYMRPHSYNINNRESLLCIHF